MRDYSQMTDESLFSLIRKDNHLAFDQIFIRHWEKLFRTVYTILEDEETARDTVQDLFAKLWLKRGEIKIENVSGYLFQAIKFQAFQHLRQKKIDKKILGRVEKIAFGLTTEEAVNFNEVNEEYQKAVDSLPERSQEIFKLSRMDNLSNQDISKRLDISIKTVEYHISIALKQLRSRMTEFISVVLFLIQG